MIPGVRGRLLSTTFASDLLVTVGGAESVPAAIRRQLQAWWRRCETTLGPASSTRAIADVALIPLLELLGFTVANRDDGSPGRWVELTCGTGARVAALAVAWNEPMAAAWRAAVVRAIAVDAGWCFCSNGTTLRIVDGRRTWSREYLEFDFAMLAEEPATQSLLWSVARAEAMGAEPTVLDRAVLLSARRGVEVCRALGVGVLQALRLLLAALARRARGRYAGDLLLDHSLTVLYRILFLLFAEARGLVPLWHPVYRDRYSLEGIVASLLAGRRCRGLWQALQAISRLAHGGCSAGELTVTAFNGRLFSPVHAAAFDRTRIDDAVMSDAIVAVSTTTVGRNGRARIAYRDLDVEQLGAVYEQVLDYQPAPAGSPNPLTRTGDKRKSTGTFYTPRAVAGFLVRTTLAPLIDGRSANEILRLRILDPAMGSGAFLVAACRYLAAAAEDALIREGSWHASDISPEDRVRLRREIASQCLFGVDSNPMAVQLARLSLWLATLSADKPLSFLDHHLIAGDSLIGAAPDDVRRQPSRGLGQPRRQAALPLLDEGGLAPALRDGASVRMKLASDPDDSAEIVRAKEKTLAALADPGSLPGRWRRVLDLWCAGWFWEAGPPPDRGTFAALVDRILHDRRTVPDRVALPILEQTQALAGRHRFLHWPLTFPEVFVASDDAGYANAGFDAIVGNPPWDMLRGDSGEESMRGDRRRDARRLTDFVRQAGIYRIESRAHVNRYQLFVERALQLARNGGRVGLVLPSGVVSDTGTAPLRRHLFDRADVDDVTGFDNRDAIFPIHRSVRFVLLTCTAGQPTSEVRCRFGITRTEELERISAPLDRAPVVLTRRFLSRLSGEDDLGVPELTGPMDLRLLERLSATFPRLGSTGGWNVQFGRELNATDDRGAFTAFTGDRSARPVVEGKQLGPFRVSLERSRFQLRDEADIQERVDRRLRNARRPRLAYRDIASATNRLTLIAAIIPARAVTTHTLFCLKTPLPAAAQHVLCALLNSYVANYLIRFRVNTHVTVSLVSRLPVPLVRSGEAAFDRLNSLSRVLMKATAPVEEMGEYAELQALVARVYGLSHREFEHVLSTFPLVASTTKSRVLQSTRPGDRDTPRH
jgi:hypothetical protein